MIQHRTKTELRRPRVIILCFVCCLSVIPALSAAVNTSRLYEEGVRLARGGQTDRAIAVFKEVVQYSPYYCLGHYGLGKAYLTKPGFNDKAVEHLELAERYDKSYAPASFYLGMAYMFGGNEVQAIHAFSRAYSSDSTIIEALYNIASLYDSMGSLAKSRLYYNQYFEKKRKLDEDILF
jgi:tetratricopeptide (TPR) repeat protein